MTPINRFSSFHDITKIDTGGHTAEIRPQKLVVDISMKFKTSPLQ
jgi:hypothetical protein